MDQNQIEEWKSIHEDIYQVDILEDTFIFRALGREEYRNIVELELDLGEFQEVICTNGVIYPEGFLFSQGEAGVAEVLADLIIDASGLHENQAASILSEYREDMENFDYQVDCMVHEAFPEFPLDEIARWPLRKSLFYMSRAEYILTNLRGLKLIPIEQLKEAQQEAKQPQPRVPEGAMVEESASFTNNKPPGDFSEGELTEEQVMALLQNEAESKGQRIGPVKTSMDGMFPEMSWFKHEDELKGNFD